MGQYSLQLVLQGFEELNEWASTNDYESLGGFASCLLCEGSISTSIRYHLLQGFFRFNGF